jgi:hypothetical protein
MVVRRRQRSARASRVKFIEMKTYGERNIDPEPLLPRRHKWTKKEVEFIYNKTRGRCYYCDKHVGPIAPRLGVWEIDHIYPWRETKSAGDVIQCVVVAWKYTKSAEEYAAIIGKPLRWRHLDDEAHMCLKPCVVSSTAYCHEHE